MDTLKIQTPEQTIELLPVTRDNLKKLRGQLVKLAVHWICNEFAIGDCLLDKKCWTDMKAAISMLPRKDNPAVGWNDLDAIANDYKQMERLFFAQDYDTRWVVGESGGFYRFNANEYKPSLLCEIHCFMPMGILQSAQKALVNESMD